MSATVDFLTPSLIRVRKYDTAEPPPQLLVRYGFFRDDWPPVPVQTEETAETLVVRSEALTVTLDKASGGIAIADASGQELLRSAEPPLVDEGLTEARFALPEDRLFFGLGDQQRERLELRGALGDLWVRNVTGYIPIPFFWTPDGFGLLVNTTRRVIVDLGHSSADWFGWRSQAISRQPAGSLDYYFIHGPSPAEIIERYTDLTGRPPMPPKWALGLWFVCRTQANDREFLEDCLHFRDRGIPCDAISLEPGWMEKMYDYSITKDWSKERFPVPRYDRNPGRYTFLRAARRMGFKPGLWLCQDYDLSYEAERRAQAEVGDTEEKAEKRGFEQDEHLTAAKRMDPLIDPAVPWFEHLKDFVDQGVEWFKQDGSNQVLEHPDRLYGNGMRDDEMHNLYPMLYSKQMYEGFAEHTGRRPFGFTCSGWAGLQRWTGTWTGDTGGEERPLVACLNLALSGHGMNTVDMEVTTKEGIHFGFLLPWVQLNSWNYFRHPWYQGEELESIFREYADLRYALIPYLYAAAWQAHRTGMPMMRPMSLMWPDDPETHKCLRQFMLGPSLLAGCFTDAVYLPAGKWYNYWTNETHDGPGRVEPTAPEGRGGPLLVKAGAIVPLGESGSYLEDISRDVLILQVFAGPDSESVLYEDDGTTLAYERGEHRTTRLSQRSTPEGILLEIAPAEGSFPEACDSREITVWLHGCRQPEGLTEEWTHLTEGTVWRWDDVQQGVEVYLGRRGVAEPVAVLVPAGEAD